jgi:hypothetical protein
MAIQDPQPPAGVLIQALLDFISNIPSTSEQVSVDPKARARGVALHASLTSSALSGTLALAPGPAGIATILPDLIGVWKIQAQMVADIAGAFGKTAFLTQEQMLYCLFRHAAAQAVRDLVVRTGERVLIRRVTLTALESIARKIGVNVTQSVLAKGISHWMPVVGALGVGAYTYYDTTRVAGTASELFASNVSIGD